MSCILETPATEEPITLSEAKSFLRVCTDDDNDFIASLISVARARAEQFTGRVFVTQKWIYWLDGLPMKRCIEIPHPPLQSISSIVLYDDNGNLYTLDSQCYFCDTQSVPGRVTFDKSKLQSGFRTRSYNAVKIEFWAGYGSAQDVPKPIQQAILETVASLYYCRGDESPSNEVVSSDLLRQYRVFAI